MYNTIRSSTHSGRVGRFEIGKEVDCYGCKYKIRDGYTAEYPNGNKYNLLIATYKSNSFRAKNRQIQTTYSFVIIKKYKENEYGGYAMTDGTWEYCQMLDTDKNIDCILRTDLGNFKVTHDFYCFGKHCYVGIYAGYAEAGLQVIWYNEEKHSYFKTIFGEYD